MGVQHLEPASRSESFSNTVNYDFQPKAYKIINVLMDSHKIPRTREMDSNPSPIAILSTPAAEYPIGLYSHQRYPFIDSQF